MINTPKFFGVSTHIQSNQKKMKHIYKIHGMTCNGCRSHVEKTLSKVEGVSKASVNLEKSEAVIEMEKHIPLNVFEKALKDDGGSYSISFPDDAEAAEKHQKKKEEKRAKQSSSGTFYCPMHCEGEKTYDKPGDCPVCGMDLVEEVKTSATAEYTCPMHPEVVRDEPGSCPKCGMDLVPKETDESAESKS
jgi:Cu2+-exporting ATPase